MELILLVSGLTLLGSFLCSLFEAALYAITPAQLELLRQSGSKGAERLARLRAAIDEPIAAILTVNTITHTVGASVCGALVAREYGGGPAVAAFAAAFTVAVLLLTEIIPKSYGVKYAARIGPLIAWPLQAMVWSVFPVVKVSGWIMKLLTGGSVHGVATEEEVVMMSRLAHREGLISRQERRWVERALLLDRLTAKDVLTPRTVVERVTSDTTVGELRELAPRWVHSRIPVVSPQDPDHVEGIVFKTRVLSALVEGDSGRRVGEIADEPRFVSTHTPAPELLDLFIEQRRHLMVVVDEYGDMAGVVTLEDVVEELLGSEIMDEHDDVADRQALARRIARERF